MNGGRDARRTLRTIGTLLWAMLCMTGARAQTTEVGSDRLRLGVKGDCCTKWQPITMGASRRSSRSVIDCGKWATGTAPFQLSLMGGVKMKYNYRVRLTPDTPETSFDFRGDDSPRHWSVCAALEVRIDRLTFDVGYEYGMNSLHADLGAYTYGASTLPPASMRISRRTSGLSMSVGVMF